MARLAPISFVKSVVDEGKKVIWPDRSTIIRHTAMVIGTIIVSTIIFAGVDLGLQKLVILAIK